MKSKTVRRAELATQKFREAEKLEKRRPIDWSERALNPLHAKRAREEGERLLAPPEHLEGAAETELVTAPEPEERLSNAHLNLLETLREPNVISVAASEQRAHAASAANVLAPAIDLAVTLGAKNSLEKMLSHQLAAAHYAAMALLVRVTQFSQLAPAEQVRLTNGAARLMEVFQTGSLTFQKLRIGGTQRVLVQHQNVQVAKGGQAIVAGRITRGSRTRGESGK